MTNEETYTEENATKIDAVNSNGFILDSQECPEGGHIVLRETTEEMGSVFNRIRVTFWNICKVNEEGKELWIRSDGNKQDAQLHFETYNEDRNLFQSLWGRCISETEWAQA